MYSILSYLSWVEFEVLEQNFLQCTVPASWKKFAKLDVKFCMDMPLLNIRLMDQVFVIDQVISCHLLSWVLCKWISTESIWLQKMNIYVLATLVTLFSSQSLHSTEQNYKVVNDVVHDIVYHMLYYFKQHSPIPAGSDDSRDALKLWRSILETLCLVNMIWPHFASSNFNVANPVAIQCIPDLSSSVYRRSRYCICPSRIWCLIKHKNISFWFGHFPTF